MTRLLSLLVALFTVTFVASPAFTTFVGFDANQLPIPQIDPPIQPASYAFSIWGLIYAWLIVSAVFGLLRRGADPDWDRARPALILSLAVGTPWLWVATQDAIWATALICLMALSAIIAMVRAPDRDRWLFLAPVAIYAGWLTAASFVSLGSTLAGYGVVFGSLGWAYAGITGALLVGLIAFSLQPRAPEYLLTIVWALVGIIVANGTDIWTVSALAGAGIVALLVAARALPPRLAL